MFIVLFIRILKLFVFFVLKSLFNFLDFVDLFKLNRSDGLESCFDYRVLLCLKRSSRIANAAQQMANVARGSTGPVTLFVERLNKLVD